MGGGQANSFAVDLYGKEATGGLSFPELAAKAATNGGKVAILWEFRSASAQDAARGPWLDQVQIALKQPAQVNCEDLDPTLTVTNAPGDGRVSKALVYDPYVLDGLLETHVNNMSDTNVQWVRLDFKVAPTVRQALAGLPAGTGQIDIDTQFYDNVFGHLCAQGIAVLGLIDYESLTDRRWEDAGEVDDQYLDEFATVTQFLVDRYRIGIRYWEIWNEPDFDNTQLQPTEFVELLQRAYDTVKATDSDDQVVFGGLGGADPTVFGAYFQDLILALADLNPLPFDIFAIHPYPSGDYRAGDGSVLVDPLDYLPFEPPTILDKFYGQLSAIGFSDQPVWITEIGWNRAKDSDQQDTLSCSLINQTMVSGGEQGLYLYRGFDFLFTQTAWSSGAAAVKKVFWYQYIDVGRSVPEADCVTTTQRASSWYGSASAQYADPATPLRVVDWWFGLFSGTDQNTPVPEPHFAACMFRHYGETNAVAACLPYVVYAPLTSASNLAAATAE